MNTNAQLWYIIREYITNCEVLYIQPLSIRCFLSAFLRFNIVFMLQKHDKFCSLLFELQQLLQLSTFKVL